MGRSFGARDATKGSMAVRNVCLLAKYGNAGKFRPEIPTRMSTASLSEGVKGPHFSGCAASGERKGVNGRLLAPGQDFESLAAQGGGCDGGRMEEAWASVTCHF
jgi:hypothetical protein